jgi:alpha-tubulin suppressor-like RCC1 family protein
LNGSTIIAMENRKFPSVAMLAWVLLLAGCAPPDLTPAYHTPVPKTAEAVSPAGPSVTDGVASASAATTPASVLSIVPVPLSAGKYHTCAVTNSGGIRCWGQNEHGQLGNGTTGKRSLPVEVVGLPAKVKAPAAGVWHTCALDETGTVLCWGDNRYGQLGDGTLTNRSTPAPVAGLSAKTVMIAAGSHFTCALSEFGLVKCWGSNVHGQLGEGSVVDRVSAVPVLGLDEPVAAIAAGEEHACIITVHGAVRCWGLGWEGQLGDGSRNIMAEAVPAAGLESGAAFIAAGAHYSCAIMTSGKVFCWGDNAMYPSPYDSPVPVELKELEGRLTSIEIGELFTCGTTVEGGVLCWGRNDLGQLGNGTGVDSTNTPIAVSGLSAGVEMLSVGTTHACARVQSGEVECWGGNEAGQAGGSSAYKLLAPAAVDLSTVHYYYGGVEASAPAAGRPPEYPSLWSRTDGFRDLMAPAVNTYSATTPRGDSWEWDFYLCATNQPRLDSLLANTRVSFLINYLPVSENAIRVSQNKTDAWICQGWRTALSGWENDQYELAILSDQKADVFDGESNFPAGEYWQIIMLSVEN